MKKVTEKEIELIGHLHDLHERWAPGNIAVTRMGGKTNRNYRVRDSEGGDWFVRIPYVAVEIVDRVVECQNIIALRECKAMKTIIPVHHLYLLAGRNCMVPSHLDRWRIDLPDGTMVAEYIEGQELSVELLQEEEVRETLVRTLHHFHTSGVNFINTYDPFQDEIAKYKRQVLEREKAVKELVGALALTEVEEVEKLMAEKLPEEKAVSTHNDLNFGNFLLAKNGQIYLLDFEYAGCNIRGGLYYDFGTLLGENMLYREGRNPLTIETFESIIEKALGLYNEGLDHSKVYICALANVLVTFWWAIMRYFQSETQEEKSFFQEIIPKRVEQIRVIRNIIDKRRW